MSVKRSYGVVDRSNSPDEEESECSKEEEILIRDNSFHYDASIDQLLDEDLEALPNN